MAAQPARGGCAVTRHSAKFASTRIDSEPADDWRHKSICRDEDPELYYPIGTSGPALLQIEQAKATCRRCPVKDECLQFALDAGIDTGIWGGLSEEERRAVKRRGGLRVLRTAQ